MSSESARPVESRGAGKRPQGGTVRPDPFVAGLASGDEQPAGGSDQPDSFVRGWSSDEDTATSPGDRA